MDARISLFWQYDSLFRNPSLPFHVNGRNSTSMSPKRQCSPYPSLINAATQTPQRNRYGLTSFVMVIGFVGPEVFMYD